MIQLAISPFLFLTVLRLQFIGRIVCTQ